MAYAMTKQGSRDNVLTYEFMCDTIADMNAIEKKYKTLGSVAIVLQGESGLEIYICGSDRQWNAMNVGSGSSGGSGADIDLSDYLQKSDIAAWAKAAQKPTYTAQEVGAATTADISAAIAQINTLQLHVCTQQEVSSGLPDIAEPDAGTIYLVASGNETGNLYEEFVWVSDAWEKIGAAGIDLSTYATKAEVPNRLSEMTNDLIYTQEPAAVTPVETTIYASNADSMIVIKDRTGKGITRTATHDVSNEEQGNNVIFTYTVNNLTLKTGEVASYQWYYSTDGGENWTIIENETTNTHTHIFSMEMWARSWKVEVTIDVQKIILDDLTWNGLTIQKNASTAYNDMYVLGRSSMGSSEIRLYRANSNPGMYSVVCYDHDSYLKSTTPSSSDDSTKVATTAWVNANAHGAEIFDTLDPDMWTDWVASTSYTVGAKVRILDANEVAHGYICKTANEDAEFDSTKWDEATAFPASGSANKVYIAKDTQQAYYWNGSSYMPLYDTEKAPIANPVFTGSISLGRAANTTIGNNSVALGGGVTASGVNAFAEGGGTQATGDCSHAEGGGVHATGANAHAEGEGYTSARTYYYRTDNTNDSQTLSEVPGAHGTANHSEGYYTCAKGSYGQHAEGAYTAVTGGYGQHVEGYESFATGNYAQHAEGYHTTAVGDYAQHTEGYYTVANGGYGAHAEGYYAYANGTYGSHAEGNSTKARGESSHAEGSNSEANGKYTHAEGYYSKANSNYSHAEGYFTEGNAQYTHAEGYGGKAGGQGSHVEGYYGVAYADYSHVEGYNTQTAGYTSHTEGMYTMAIGMCTHAEGYNTVAQGTYSSVSGTFNVEEPFTDFPVWTASTEYKVNDIIQRNDGQYPGMTRTLIYRCKTAHTSASTFDASKWEQVNKKGIYAEIVGNGEAYNARSNARALTWTGDERLAGDVYVHCNNDSTGGTKLATVNDVEAMATRIAELESQVTSLMNALKLLNIPEDNVQGTDGTPITDEALNYLEFDKPTT